MGRRICVAVKAAQRTSAGFKPKELKSMYKRLMKICLSLLFALSMLATCAGAETVRGDLSERFSDIPRIEYEGQTYTLKNRITTVLAMGIGQDEAEKPRADVNFMLIIDDNAKTFSVVEIPADTLVQVIQEDGTPWNMRFQDVYALGEDSDAGGMKMVETLNTVLGEARVEHYLAFDAEGAAVLDASLAVIEDTKERLKAMMTLVEEMDSDQLNDTYKLLGDYIITDMKSGAVMKVIDKMDRYEVLPRIMLPGAQYNANDGGTLYVADVNEILKLRVNAFYEVDGN